MKGELVEKEDLNRQGRSVWIGRGGGSPAVAIPLGRGSGKIKASDYRQIDTAPKTGRLCWSPGT